MIELIKKVEVLESKMLVKNGTILLAYERYRQFEVTIEFEDLEAIESAFDLSYETLKEKVENNFIPALVGTISK